MKKYRHKKEILAEAIGFEKEELKNLVTEYNRLVSKLNSDKGKIQSHAIQGIEKFAQKSPENLRLVCAIAAGGIS